MSEEIYAWLLRLLPRAFRRKYEDDAFQLLRDRLGDERGFFRRFRLGVDLILDIVRALPRAYRNAYADLARRYRSPPECQSYRRSGSCKGSPFDAERWPLPAFFH